MSDPPIPKDCNNYYHPRNERQIIALVDYARENSFQVRVRASGHSMPQSIYTDECSLDEVDVLAPAPDGDNVNIMLDRYADIISVDEDLKLATVEAGIHLGHDPNNPRSRLQNSLLYQLHEEYGLTVDALGGITHQTVGGFLTTGSSGGSLTYSVQVNVHAMRFVDGKGKIFEVSRDDTNQDNFNASLVSLGLLGVLSTVTFRCVDTFNITGNQVGTLTNDAAVDIFSDNPESEDRIGLTTFLKETEYARMVWWPQSSQYVDEGQDRIQIWQARRMSPSEDFERNPFAVFDNTEIMMLYSYLMILIGNIDDMEEVRRIAATKEEQFKKLAIQELMDEHDLGRKKATIIANLLQQINTLVLNLVTTLTDAVPLETRELLLPHFTTFAIRLLNEIDKDVEFQDYGYSGLPMDNSADDIIVPVMWTELWAPLSRATKITTLLRDYFKNLPKNDTFNRTGNNAWELYATKPSDAWLSMAYSDGQDEWKDGAFRVDPYWFIHTKADYRDLYRPIWLLFKKNNIPFRLHWSKSFPLPNDPDITANDLVATQYPRLSSFLTLREARDPDGIFLSSYWRHWLDIGIQEPKKAQKRKK